MPAGGTPFGRYVLGESLAVGGMGEVFVAMRVGLGGFEKPLAVKVLLPHLAEDPEAVQGFLDEARLAARMNHPNVVQIFDVDSALDCYFIAMELVRGVSLARLASRLRKQGIAIPAGAFLHIAHSVCRGLHHAHELRDDAGQPLEIVHRDISPENVLLSSTGEVKLTDFGIAKAAISLRLTSPGLRKGKIDYMAPEQAAGQPLTRRADIYSLGLVLYELAAGVGPSNRTPPEQTLHSMITAAVSDQGTQLPSEVWKTLLRAIAQKPEERFDTVEQMALHLPAPPPSAAAELATLIDRHCRDSVRKLEQRTAGALRARDRTATLGALTPEVQTMANRRRRRWWWAGGAAVALGLAALASWSALRQGAARPDPVVAAEPEQPAPAVDDGPPPVDAVPTAAPTAVPTSAAGAAHDTRHVRPAPARMGSLSIDAIPWGRVSVDGKSIGETPIDHYPAPVGELTVELTNPETGKSVVRHVRVAAGRTVALKVDLR